MIVNFNTYTDVDLIQNFVYQTFSGAVIPFSVGDSLRMHARSDPADSTVWLELTTINGLIVITNYSAGAFTLTMPLATLLKIPTGVYQHSLVWTQTTLIRSEIWRGTITHSAGPTRWKPGTV